MKKIIWCLFLIFIISFGLGKTCNIPFISKIPEAVKKAAKNPGVIILSSEVSQVTPRGAKHFGNKRISDAQLQLIDDGIAALFRAAKEDGFNETAIKPYDWFEIFSPPYECIPSPVSRTPSFLIGGGYYYDGTEYDQYNTKGKLSAPKNILDVNGNLVKTIVYVEDGLSAVFAAEYVISIGTPPSRPPVAQFYVCPDISVLKDGVNYGGDHAFLANFPYSEKYHKTGREGLAYFNRSLYHSAGIGHPLLPRGDRLFDDSVADEKVVSDLLGNGDVQEKPLSDEMKKLAEQMAKEAGVELTLSGNEREVKGTMIIRAVR